MSLKKIVVEFNGQGIPEVTLTGELRGKDQTLVERAIFKAFKQQRLNRYIKGVGVAMAEKKRLEEQEKVTATEKGKE
jgi:hypothetical protein